MLQESLVNQLDTAAVGDQQPSLDEHGQHVGDPFVLVGIELGASRPTPGERLLVRVALRILPRGGFADHGAIGLIFGGAIGNLIDRARFGAVIDFVDVHYRGWHWPAFNVADSAITVGVTVLAIRLLGEGASAPRP